jgi:type VI secretion system protein ImpG
VPRTLSHKQRGSKQHDPQLRSSYIGSEVFLSLVDADEAPYRSSLRELSLTTMCTNRDLPLLMPVGRGKTDFTLESGAPLAAIRCVAGPTRPRPSYAEGINAWRLISHLSLNYLSLLDNDEQQGAAALRDLLRLYTPASDPHRHRQKGARDELLTQVEGVRSVSAKAITRRMPVPGPITFGRGLEIQLTLDDHAFEGVGPFLLGAVLAEFFRRYVSVNSFTETVLRTPERGEVMRWVPRNGRRHTL